MANKIQSGLKRISENAQQWIHEVIATCVHDIDLLYGRIKDGYTGIIHAGNGDIITVDHGLIQSIEAPPLPETSLKLTWDDIGNALYTDVVDYNTEFGSDFTTLTVDGNDQLLTGNSVPFSFTTYAFVANANIISINDEIDSIIEFSDGRLDGCTNLTTIIANACTSVGEYTFHDCASLTTVTLDACTTLGYGAFQGCTSLTTVTFPACTSIDASAFQACTSLTTVTFPACTSVGANAFQDCTSLTTATLDACTTLWDNVFKNCTALTSVDLTLCTNLGGTTGNDDVFTDISGQTITLTVPASLETCDGGNPDGDIVYLEANNTATIIYI